MKNPAWLVISATLALTVSSCGSEAYERTYQLSELLWTQTAEHEEEACFGFMLSPDEFSKEMLGEIAYEFEGAEQEAVTDFLIEKCGNTDAATRTQKLAAYLWTSMEDYHEGMCAQYSLKPEEFADEMLQEIKRDFEDAVPQVVADFLAEQCD